MTPADLCPCKRTYISYVAYVKEESSTLLEEISTNGIAISLVNPSKLINRNYFNYPNGANRCKDTQNSTTRNEVERESLSR